MTDNSKAARVDRMIADWRRDFEAMIRTQGSTDDQAIRAAKAIISIVSALSRRDNDSLELTIGGLIMTLAHARALADIDRHDGHPPCNACMMEAAESFLTPYLATCNAQCKISFHIAPPTPKQEQN